MVSHLIGNVDEFCLKTENAKYEEDILKIIDQLETNSERSEKVRLRIHKLEDKNSKIKSTAANLVSLSKKQSQVMRHISKLNSKLAARLKQKEERIGQLSRQL